MIRGGAWNNTPDNLRSSNRNRNTTDNRNNNIGFRLAQAARTAHSRPGAILFMDRMGAAAGVHEPASRPPPYRGTPNREPGVRRSGAGGFSCRPRTPLDCVMSFFISLPESCWSESIQPENVIWSVRTPSTRPLRWLLRANGPFTNGVSGSQPVFSQPRTTGHRPVATKAKLLMLVLLCRDVPVGRLSEVRLTVFHRRYMPKGRNCSTDLL